MSDKKRYQKVQTGDWAEEMVAKEEYLVDLSYQLVHDFFIQKASLNQEAIRLNKARYASVGGRKNRGHNRNRNGR